MKRYPYAMPDRIAIFGATYQHVRHFIANELDPLETMGMELTLISAAGHPGTVQGMRLRKVIEVPGVTEAPNYQRMREDLDHCLTMGRLASTPEN